jgi:hypothetical protein
MKTPNEDIQRKVRQWLSYADEDLRLAIAQQVRPSVRTVLDQLGPNPLK